MNGMAGWNALTGGAIAGEGAARYAADATRPAIDRDAVQAVLADAYDKLSRTGEGKRASEVQREVQRLSNTYLFGARTEEGLNTVIAELERIASEEVPSMVLADHSRQFNTEWRMSLEVPFMITCNLAIAHAALARTETRGFHHRLDYPNMDNTNWLKNVWVSQNEGSWSTDAQDVVDSHLSADKIRELVPEIGIGEYPQA